MVKTDLLLGEAEVHVRALPFREQMKVYNDNAQLDRRQVEAMLIARCTYDQHGELIFDPLDEDHINLIIEEKFQDFWTAITNAMAESGASPGKASAQTPSS